MPLLLVTLLLGVLFLFDGWLGVLGNPNFLTLRAGLTLIVMCAIATWQRTQG
jgi:hypothetical protein